MGIKGWPCSPPSLGRCHEPLHCHLAMNNGTGFRGIDEQTALLMERRHTILAAWLHETPNRRPQSRPLTRWCPPGSPPSTPVMRAGKFHWFSQMLAHGPGCQPSDYISNHIAPNTSISFGAPSISTNGWHCNFWRPALNQLLFHEEEHVTSLGLSSNGRRCSTTILRADLTFLATQIQLGLCPRDGRRSVPVGGVVDDEHL